jgi:RNA polymerase sigma-70 factor (ECF subfamily)
MVGHAAAVAEARGAEAGALALDALDAAVAAQYQPYWALRAHVMGRLGRVAEAETAYTRAIGLSEDPATRAFLARRAAALRGGPR